MSWRTNPPSPAQLSYVKSIATQLGLEDTKGYKKALLDATFCRQFISAFADELERRQIEIKQTLLDEAPVMDVKKGDCPDPVAMVRGQAIADLLGLKAIGKGEDVRYKTTGGMKSAGGLYRSVIRVTIECKDHL